MKKATRKSASKNGASSARNSTKASAISTKTATAPVAALPATSPTKSAPVPASAAPTPAPVKSATPAASPVITAAAPVTIEAKIDVGFGNNLFVRGQGEGLSWERGIPLENVDSQTWRLTVPAKEKLQFKLLLNDTVWAKGDDLVATPGNKIEVTPAF